RRVEDQRRVKNGKAERRKDLNEEQRGRSLRSPGETTFEKFDEADAHHLRSLPRELDRLRRLIRVGSIHHALLCRSLWRAMSSFSWAAMKSFSTTPSASCAMPSSLASTPRSRSPRGCNTSFR